ncbi:ribosome maturation factor RimP [Actinomyces slackii]|uniref:Ribosome maturation factor RimP n=1 Tax=Actinomyces slackii TaxID=52774 RepID=A0A3S4SGM2_9ACTO|nr:ribosome maturation factor RimP [Actinomyces slackii]VEG75578.1 Ribosome maturation factor RimP [Actinomyces slackii]
MASKADPRADALTQRLTELLGPVVSGCGLFLEGVRTTRAGKHSVVRVFVDLPDGPGDLDLDGLGEVTSAVSQALDEADPIAGQYTLEVSTPGAERPLSTPRHFRRAVGHGAAVDTAQGRITGTVISADDDALVLEAGGERRIIALAEIDQARMIVTGP